MATLTVVFDLGLDYSLPELPIFERKSHGVGSTGGAFAPLARGTPAF
jgi:hypothetical protein